MPFISNGLFPAPDSLQINEEKDSVLIQPKGIFWDTFSTLFLFIAVAASFVLLAGGVYLTIIGTSFPIRYWIFGAIVLIGVIYFALRLFISNILILGKDYISVCETLFGAETKENKINADKIENIELSYNPTIGRYDLTIISDDKMINFGSRLPVSDLLWLKDFVIRKLIGN